MTKLITILSATLFPLLALTLIGAGVAAIHQPSAAIVVGSLMWLDITIERYKHDSRKHDRGAR